MVSDVCSSVPYDEYSLGLERFLCLDEMFDPEFAVMRDFSPHVIYHEWFREVVFIVSEGHCLEV